jgi:hypothetical protein
MRRHRHDGTVGEDLEPEVTPLALLQLKDTPIAKIEELIQINAE